MNRSRGGGARLPMVSVYCSSYDDSKGDNALDVSDLTGDNPAAACCADLPALSSPRRILVVGKKGNNKKDVPPHQELVEAKLQIARQREELDGLRSALVRSRAEIAALEARCAGLVEEGSKPRPQQRFSFNAGGGRGAAAGGGSMQMLVSSSAQVAAENVRLASENARLAEENARLAERDLQLSNENARLQASADGFQRSLRDYIRFSEKVSREEGDRRDALTVENEALRRRIGDLEGDGGGGPSRGGEREALKLENQVLRRRICDLEGDGSGSGGGCTVRTSFETESTSDEGTSEGTGGSSRRGDTGGAGRRRVKGSPSPPPPPGGSGELIVDFASPGGVRGKRATMP